MRVKIHGGTVGHGDPPLCETCRYATVVRGASLGDEIVECSQLVCGGGRITFPVMSCSSYSDRRRPSLREMEEIAWILRSDPKRNEIGFVRAAKLRDRERYVLVEDGVGEGGRAIPRDVQKASADSSRAATRPSRQEPSQRASNAATASLGARDTTPQKLAQILPRAIG